VSTDLEPPATPTAVPRWGLGDALGGWVLAVVASTLLGVVVLGVTGVSLDAPAGVGAALGEVVGRLGSGRPPAVTQPPPLALTAVLQLPLWAVMVAVPLVAAATKGNGAVRDFGLRMRAIDVPVGLVVGAACQLVAVPALYWLLFRVIGEQDVSAEARQLTERATDPFGVLVLFAIVAIGAPVAEELFFRGLTQRAFRKRGLGWVPAVGATAVVFAASHLQPLQFPALVLAGIVFGVLAERSGRLGPAIWAHVGFNGVAAAVLVWRPGWL